MDTRLWRGSIAPKCFSICFRIFVDLLLVPQGQRQLNVSALFSGLKSVIGSTGHVTLSKIPNGPSAESPPKVQRCDSVLKAKASYS